MANLVEVKVPDIGDFKDVPVIEVLIAPGDSVKKEDSLVTLESDKATMEVPSPASGIVKDVRVKVGDKVSEGSPVVVLEASDGAEGGAERAAPVASHAAASAPDVAAPGRSAPAAKPQPVAFSPPGSPSAAAPQPSVEAASVGNAHASPAVRRLAIQLLGGEARRHLRDRAHQRCEGRLDVHHR